MYFRGAGILIYGIIAYFPSLKRISWSIIRIAGSSTIRYSFSSSNEEFFVYEAIRNTSVARSLTIDLEFPDDHKIVKRLRKARKRLEDIFSKLLVVSGVITVCEGFLQNQNAAQDLLHVEERTMRQWCAGQDTPPASVFRALSPRLTHTERLRRTIESNEETIAALQDVRITGLGYGPGLSDPQSVAVEIDRLRKQNEEHLALVRLEEAFQRKQEAYFGLNKQWLPHGNGLPTDETISEVDAAEEEFRT
jgi:hypothetical protein